MKKNGIFLALSAYTLWGLLPVYWKMVQIIPAYALVCHRVIWSLLFLLLILFFKRQLRQIFRQFRHVSNLYIMIITAVLLAGNWFIYIWAVNNEYLVEASLGYFINPLINVILGMLFLKEILRKWQWTAIGLAACGVFFLTFLYGSLPWIAYPWPCLSVYTD